MGSIQTKISVCVLQRTTRFIDERKAFTISNREQNPNKTWVHFPKYLWYRIQGRDIDGYNVDGFDRAGFDRDGYDVNGFDRAGFDRDGYNREKFDKDGYNKKGFNRERTHQNGTKFDENGLNWEGYSKDGYDQEGKDRLGYTRHHYTKKIQELEEHLANAEILLKERDFSSTATKMRLTLEISAHCLLNHRGIQTSDRSNLRSLLSALESHSILDSTRVKELQSVRDYCNIEVHDSGVKNTHQTLKWSFHTVSKLSETLRSECSV